MWNYFDHMGSGFGLGWIFMLAFWGLIIWAIITLARGLSGQHRDGCCGSHQKENETKVNSAVDILKERYAKGEISKDDFDKMKKDLE